MEIKEKSLFAREVTKIFGGWVPREVVKDFFKYGNTKMSTFASDHNIRMSKVGRRIFYDYDDVVRLINKGSQ